MTFLSCSIESKERRHFYVAPQKDRQTDRQTDGQTDRKEERKKERKLSLCSKEKMYINSFSKCSKTTTNEMGFTAVIDKERNAQIKRKYFFVCLNGIISPLTPSYFYVCFFPGFGEPAD